MVFLGCAFSALESSELNSSTEEEAHPVHILRSRPGFWRTLHGRITPARAGVLASNGGVEPTRTRLCLARTRFPLRSRLREGPVATCRIGERTEKRGR